MKRIMGSIIAMMMILASITGIEAKKKKKTVYVIKSAKIYYNKQGESPALDGKITASYDKKGHRKTWIVYKYNSNSWVKDELCSFKYSYNKAGYMTKAVRGDGQIFKFKNTVKKKKLRKVTMTAYSSKITKTYNTKGLLTGCNSDKYKYTYYSKKKGTVKKLKMYHPGEAEKNYHRYITYNKKGQIKQDDMKTTYTSLKKTYSYKKGYLSKIVMTGHLPPTVYWINEDATINEVTTFKYNKNHTIKTMTVKTHVDYKEGHGDEEMDPENYYETPATDDYVTRVEYTYKKMKLSSAPDKKDYKKVDKYRVYGYDFMSVAAEYDHYTQIYNYPVYEDDCLPDF